MAIKEYVDRKKEEFVREHMLSDEFMAMMHENMAPMNTLFSYYRCAIMEVETKFKVLNEQFSLEYDRNPIESIKSRIKSVESLAKKVRDRGIALDPEEIEKNITDIAGLRIICSFPEDIYMLAECLLRQDDITLIERKDYIKNPKPGGYRSLHLIVSVPIFLKDETRDMKVEVQLRTIAMDFWASLEHKMNYKLEQNAPDSIKQELFECAQMVSLLDDRMLTLNEEIQTEIERQNRLKASRAAGKND